MAPYKIIISYDGSDFYGFQRQKDSRTVQGELETALGRLGWTGSSIMFSGRTDAGVHAEGQTIAFDLMWAHSEFELVKALNSHLPDDISAVDAEIVSKQFHPRYDARIRVYRYQIYQNRFRNSLLDRNHWRIWPEVDLERVKKGMRLLTGTHDFQNFGKAPDEKSTTIRTIQEIELSEFDKNIIHVQISAQAYLYHMVRRIVFILVKIGQGMVDQAHLKDALELKRDLPDGIAPANGLYFVRTVY